MEGGGPSSVGSIGGRHSKEMVKGGVVDRERE